MLSFHSFQLLSVCLSLCLTLLHITLKMLLYLFLSLIDLYVCICFSFSLSKFFFYVPLFITLTSQAKNAFPELDLESNWVLQPRNNTLHRPRLFFGESHLTEFCLIDWVFSRPFKLADPSFLLSIKKMSRVVKIQQISKKNLKY